MVCGIMVKEHIPTLIMCSEAECVCNMGRGVCVCVLNTVIMGVTLFVILDMSHYTRTHTFELCFYALVDKLFSNGHAQNAR